MKFLDSNIIAYAFYENGFQKNCRNLIRGGGVVDTLVLIEAFNIIELQVGRKIAVKAIRSLFKLNFTIIAIDINIVFESLKGPNKLKFIDLIHYTVALMNNCSAIMSYDKDFDNLDILREEE